jgi:uncharacterized protein YkwD
VLRSALRVAFAVALIAFGSAAPAAATGRIDAGATSASPEGDLIALINAYRSSHGLQHVSPNGALTAAAAWMAGDMAAKNYMAHVSSDGRSPTQRMSAFGYPATSTYTGEDLAAGFETAGAVLAGWQASAAHNAVLLSPNYDAVGIGLAHNPSSTYGWYWAANFGGPGGTVRVANPPPPPAPVAPPRSSAPPEARPVAERAEPAPRGSQLQPAEELVDHEAVAEEARIAFVYEKRLAHLFALLRRMGEI